MTLMVLHICSCAEVTFDRGRSRVWSQGDSSSACVWRIILLKKKSVNSVLMSVVCSVFRITYDLIII